MGNHNTYIQYEYIASKVRKPGWDNLPLYKKILNYRNELTQLHAQYTDKINAKSIVKNVCGSIVKTAKIIRILENTNDLHSTDINPDTFLKAAHGCGWIVDLAQPNALQKGKLALKQWDRTFSYEEKQYTFIKPRFFIEEKVHCAHFGKKTMALDIKVNCFYGKPVFLSVQTPDKKRNYYTLDWKHVLPPEFHYERSNDMDILIEAAALLSKPFEFVRMDFYIGIDGVYFSEFTFTPKNGQRRLPEELELEFGKNWK